MVWLCDHVADVLVMAPLYLPSMWFPYPAPPCTSEQSLNDAYYRGIEQRYQLVINLKNIRRAMLDQTKGPSGLALCFYSGHVAVD